MLIDAAIVLAILLALLVVLLARHWPRPVLVIARPRNPLGFMPPA
jgi:hypothetical protein